MPPCLRAFVPRSAALAALVVFCFLAARFATAADKPNILFCIADDASFPHMGAYGCSWIKTPGFDRVAKEGLLFTRAYTPNAKCAPSRACILTGRNSWQLEEAANHICHFPAKFKTWAEALADNGYFVGFTAKGWGPGDPGTVAGKPRQLTGQPFNKARLTPPASGISPNDYAANFKLFLQARAADQAGAKKPFCFWYGGLEPHRQYEFGSGVAKGGKKLSDIAEVPSMWPDNEVVRNDLLDYAYEIEHFDRHIVTMLAALEEIGELDNTLVVVTADNGMPFPRVKGQEYEMSNHLPLAIMWRKGIKTPGRVIDHFVSFIDFAPTFLEVAGVDPNASAMQPIQGRSLSELFVGGSSGQKKLEAREHVLIGKERHDVGRPHDQGYPIRGIIKDGFLYIKNFEPDRWPAGNPETGYLNVDGGPTKTNILTAHREAAAGQLAPGATKKADALWELSFGKRPAEELFQIESDAFCLKNLAADPQYARIKKALAEQMTKELTDQGDPRMLGNGKIFDQYEYADPKQRGFYERYMAGEKVKAGWVNESDFEPRKKD